MVNVLHMIKRIFLFLLTNILIVVTLSLVLNLLGVRPYLSANGIDYNSLLVFCLVWGMGGSFISLLMSRWMAKMMMGVKVIDPRNPGEYHGLVSMIENISKVAQLPKTPEIGVYESPELNAFATGPSKSRSLVAVSTGLLNRMSRDEIEGVMAHEIAHIKNGDMVTMTLLQGIVNAVVMFIARIVAFAASQAVKEENRWWVHTLVVIVLEIGLSLLGMLVVMGFSRHREFKADAGSAKLVGANKMIAGLEALQRHFGRIEPNENEPQSVATLKISGGKSWLSVLSSHPPLEDRIKALKTAQYMN
jgi:heat shock protein HtpX